VCVCVCSRTGGGECAVTMTDAEVKVVELLTEEATGGVAVLDITISVSLGLYCNINMHVA